MPEPTITTPLSGEPAGGRFLRLGPRAWLATLLGFALFYFYSGGGPNQASRFDLDRALLEHGRVTIDDYHNNTIDKAFHKGHHYSDKAPGSSLAALPALAVARVVFRFIGIDPVSAPGLLAQMHVATAWVATLPAILMCLTVFDWSVRRGYSRKGAAFAALALGLTSPVWAYAGLFWGHVLAAFCLLVGAYNAMTLAQQAQQTDAPQSGATRRALLAGLAAGAAVLTEFPSAPAALLIALFLVWKLRPYSRWIGPLAAYAAGAAAMALLLGAYNKAAFGSAFHLGYASVQGFDGMRRGLFGVTHPSPEALYGLLLSPRRGLLFSSPVLLLGLIGHGLATARSSQRSMAILSLIVVVYVFLLNASYTYWDGGFTYGPRHLTLALPFLALGLAPLFDSLWRFLRPLAWMVLLGGVFLTVVAVSTNGMTPDGIEKPLPTYFWPAFRDGRVALSDGYTDSGGPATNLGLALGLRPSRSLFPLLLGFIAGGTGLLISLRQLAGRPRLPVEPHDVPSAPGDGSSPVGDRADPAPAADRVDQQPG